MPFRNDVCQQSNQYLKTKNISTGRKVFSKSLINMISFIVKRLKKIHIFLSKQFYKNVFI